MGWEALASRAFSFSFQEPLPWKLKVRGWDGWKVVRHQVGMKMKEGLEVTHGEAASSHKSLSSTSNLSEDPCSYSSFSL